MEYLEKYIPVWLDIWGFFYLFINSLFWIVRWTSFTRAFQAVALCFPAPHCSCNAHPAGGSTPGGHGFWSHTSQVFLQALGELLQQICFNYPRRKSHLPLPFAMQLLPPHHPLPAWPAAKPSIPSTFLLVKAQSQSFIFILPDLTAPLGLARCAPFS